MSDLDFADVQLLGRMLRLVDFLAQPEAVKAHTAALLDAATKADAATEENRKSSANLDAKKSAVLASLVEAKNDHDEKLRADRREFEDQCNSREAALRDHEAAVSESAKKLAAGHQEVADLKADLSNRIAAINRAADPRPFPRAVG